jgi:diadenosine tetraphosphate (Ap4A) HIT family hydrolase
MTGKVVIGVENGAGFDCQFCSAAEPVFRAPGAWWNVPLFETDAFVVWPSLGALVAGWILIVPKRHLLCLAVLSTQLKDELSALESAFRDRLESSFGLPVISFEHGPSEPGDPVSCTIDHAHLHVVPTATELRPRAAEIAGLPEWNTVTGLGDCRSIHERGLSYVYLRTPDGREQVLAAKKLPSQLMRRVIAESKGPRVSWDWREHHRLNTVWQTRDALKAASVT